MSVRYAVPAHNPAGLQFTSRIFGGITPPVVPTGQEHTRALGDPTVSSTAAPVLLSVALQGASNVGGVTRQVPTTITVQPGSRILRLLVPPVAVSPASLDHTRAQGSLTVSPSIVPAGLTHTRAQGAPTVNPQLLPAAQTHTRALGDPTVTVPTAHRYGAMLQGASSLDSVVRQVPQPVLDARRQVSQTVTGTASLTQLLPGALEHTRALGDPTVSIPSPPVTPPGIILQGSSNATLVTRQAQYAPAQEPKNPTPGVFVFVYSAPPIFNVIVPGGTNQGYKFFAAKQAPSPAPAERQPRIVPKTLAAGVAPSGLEHARALGAPVLQPHPASLTHTRALGSPTIGAAIVRALGNPVVTVQWVARPAGQEHSRAQGAPVAHGRATLAPTGLERTRAQGTPTLSARVLPEGLTRTRVLGAPSVNPKSLAPAALSHTRGQGAAAITIAWIARPASLEHTRTQGAPIAHGFMLIGPPSITRTRTQGTPILSGRALPASLTHTRALGAAAVNVMNLAPLAISRA